MNAKIARLEDEKRRREELSAYCRHVTAVLDMFQYSLDQLNPANRERATRHIRSEMKRLFGV
jgi:hypothetical protein